MTRTNVWAAENVCTSSVLHTKTKNVDCGRKLLRERNSKCRRSRKYHSLQLRLLSSVSSNIVYLWYIFYFGVEVASLHWINFNTLHLRLASWIYRVLSKHGISHNVAAFIPDKKRRLYRHVREKRHKNTFSVALYLEGFHFCK